MVRGDDLSAVQLNPASLAHIKGTLIELGNRFSYNALSFERQPTQDWGHTQNGVPPRVPFAEVDNGQPWQAVDPMLGAISDLGLRDWRFALAIYSPAGVGREDFPIDGGQRYMMVSRDTKIIDYGASVAWNHDDVFGFGASLLWIWIPKLKYQLVIDASTFPRSANPVSSALDMLATVDGSDPFTFNMVVGAWYKPAPFLELGISAQVIPTQIKAASKLSLQPLTSAIMDQVVLRRGTEVTNDVSLTLPLPITARAGARYVRRQGKRELFDVELDGTYEAWSAVRDFTLDARGLTVEFLSQRLALTKIEVPKHWHDTVGVQLGSDYAVLADLLTLRGGVFYQTALASPAYAHVDFLSGSRLGATIGASVLLGSFEIALAYEYRYMPTIRGAEADARVYQQTPGSQCVAPYTDPDLCNAAYLGQPAPAVNAGSYRADSSVASLDLLYRF